MADQGWNEGEEWWREHAREVIRDEVDEEVRGRPFRRVCDVILWEGFGPDGIEDRNEDEDVEEGEDETINLLEAVTDLVLDGDDMPVDMPVHQPRFPLPDEARHGPISIRGSQTRFDLDWEYVLGEDPVPLQNAVNELREFDEAGRHFPVTLDGVNLRQGVGGNAGRRWTVRNNHNGAGPPNAYFGMADMNQAGVTGRILVDAVNELNEQLEAAAEFHRRAGPVVRITPGSVKVFTQRYWAQMYHRDDAFFRNHRDSIERGEGIISLNFGGVSTLKFHHRQHRPIDDWDFELDREYLGYTYMSPCARLLRHAVTYADGELAAQQRELEQEQQEQEQEQQEQQPQQPQQQQPQQPQQQQQGADAAGGVEDEDDENARGVSVVYLFTVSVREGYWRDKGPEWHATFNRAVVAFLVSFWLDRQLQRPQGGGGGEDDDDGGGGGGGDDGNQPQQVQPPGAGGEDGGGENDDNDGLVPLNQLPRNPFNPPSEEDIRNLFRVFGHNQHQVIEHMSRSQRLQRISEQVQQSHQKRFNNARATKEESEETCTKCCENKDRQTCFRDGNKWCIACSDQHQQSHQERFNKAHATKQESEETCTKCCENKDRQTCFRDGNKWCIACLDAKEQWHQERFNKAHAVKQESEETCTRCCENKDRQTCFRNGNSRCNACLDVTFNNARATKEESEETCTKCCENKDRQTCFRNGNKWCNACLDQHQQSHQKGFNKARATKEESEETCAQCCENKDRQTCFRNGNSRCNACLDQRQQWLQERFNKAHAVKQESEETCTRCIENKDRQTCFRDGNAWCIDCLEKYMRRKARQSSAKKKKARTK